MISSASSAHAVPRRVAVVLDLDVNARDLLAAQLRGCGCRALCAANLDEARRLVVDEAPAFVFVACAGLGRPVAEIAAALMPEGARPIRPPRVVAVCDGCTGCGVDLTLPKPVALDALRGLLASAAEPRAVRQPAQRTPAEALRDLDPETLRALLRVFEEDASARLGRVGVALDSGNLHQVEREAHAIKSGCLQIGADAMAGHCEQLRTAAKAQDVGLARQAYDELAASFGETMAVSTPIS